MELFHPGGYPTRTTSGRCCCCSRSQPRAHPTGRLSDFHGAPHDTPLAKWRGFVFGRARLREGALPIKRSRHASAAKDRLARSELFPPALGRIAWYFSRLTHRQAHFSLELEHPGLDVLPLGVDWFHELQLLPLGRNHVGDQEVSVEDNLSRVRFDRKENGTKDACGKASGGSTVAWRTNETVDW